MSAYTIHPGAPVDRTVSHDAIAVLTGSGLAAVIAERVRQVDEHGYTLHRDQITAEALDLPSAAIAYGNAALDQIAGLRGAADPAHPDPTWPWSAASWSPDATPRENLAKAAALMWAAIDWLDQRDAQAAASEARAA